MDNAEKLNAVYWSNRYQSNTANWDLNQVSPPIKEYINQLTNKNYRILIPGCGNSYEAEYLLQQGFTDITIIDIAPNLIEQLKLKFKNKPTIQIILGDFFTLQQSFDLIFEQTFFCALDPSLRKEYVSKMHSLLKPKGKLVGLLFNRNFEGGPPFGGTMNEYSTLFSQHFTSKVFESCFNSFIKRQETELFIILIKK